MLPNWAPKESSMKFSSIPVNRIISEKHPLVVLGLSATIAVVLVLRCFNAVFYPILFNEDGTQIFAYFLNNPYPSEIFRFYEGYISLIPNLIGFITTSLFPMHVVPYLMVSISLGFAVVALSMFSLRRFRFIMPDDKSRILVCLIVALFPLGNHALVTNVTFSIWNIFTIALLMILSPLPNSKWARSAQLGFIALAVFSHPYSVLLIPICIALIFMRPSLPDRMTNAGIIVLAVLYFFLGVNRSVVIPQADVTTILVTFECIVHRIVFEPVFGNNLRMILQEAGQPSVIYLLASCIVAALVAVVANNTKTPELKNKLPMFGFLLFVVLSLTYISVFGRLGKYESFLSFAWAQRYFYTQQLLFVFMIVLYAVGLASWKRWTTIAKIAVATFLVCYVSYLNIHHVPYFKTSREHGIATIRFLREADRQLSISRSRGEVPQQMILHRDGKWDIKIIVPGNEEHR